MGWLGNFIFGKSYKCDCGDVGCKRQIKGTSAGALYVINHFTCGKVKKQIKELSKLKLK